MVATLLLTSAVGAGVTTSAIVLSRAPSDGVGAPRSATIGSGLEVTPGNWSMTSGSSVDLRAYLVPASNGCIPIDAVYTWQLVGASGALGYLNTTDGANERFFAFTFAAGAATVLLAAVGLEVCDGPLTFTASTQATVHIYPPLVASSVLPARDPLPVGAGESLSVQVGGGLPPYALAFDFGDGGSGSIELASAGTVNLSHAYPEGTFDPSVTITDALDDHLAASAARPVTVAPRLGVVILAPTSEVDSGRALEVSASVLGGVGSDTVVWNDTEGAVGTGPTWRVNLSTPGSANLSVTVTDGAGEVAADVLHLEVAAPLTAELLGAPSSLDLGDPLGFNLSIAGGTAPFEVSASALPSGSGFVAAGLSARAFPAALLASAPGPMWVALDVVDALGATVHEVIPVAQVDARPSLTVFGATEPAEVGSPFELVGEVAGGSPPFVWSALASGPLGNSTPLSGALPARGPFALSATLVDPGTLAVTVEVRDASGAVVDQNLSMFVARPLSGNLSLVGANITSGTAVPFALRAEGGVAPYSAAIQLSDGELRTANLSAAGTMWWNAIPNRTGPLIVHATLSDGAGRTWSETVSLVVGPRGSAPVLLPPTPPASPPAARGGDPPAAGWSWGPFAAGFGIATFAAAILAGLWTRWKGRTGGAAPVAPATSEELKAVRRVLRENDGIDPPTFELLAEDEGLDRERADVALRAWDRLGKVTREREDGAPELLRWQDQNSSEGEGSGAGPRDGGEP